MLADLLISLLYILLTEDLGPTDLSTEDREKIVKGLECLIREWYPGIISLLIFVVGFLLCFKLSIHFFLSSLFHLYSLKLSLLYVCLSLSLCLSTLSLHPLTPPFSSSLISFPPHPLFHSSHPFLFVYFLSSQPTEIFDCFFSPITEARLHLFGSSCNGFGFQNSDLDICITFCNHQNADVSITSPSSLQFLSACLPSRPDPFFFSSLLLSFIY